MSQPAYPQPVLVSYRDALHRAALKVVYAPSPDPIAACRYALWKYEARRWPDVRRSARK